MLPRVQRAVALPGNVENLSDGQVRPNFDPFGLEVAIERASHVFDGGVVIAQFEIDFAQAVVGEGGVLVQVEHLPVLRDGLQVGLLLLELVAARHFHIDACLVVVLEQPAGGVHHYALGFEHGVDGEVGGRPDHIHALVHGFTTPAVYADFHRHAENIQVLLDLSDDLIRVGRAVGGPGALELRHARGGDPEREEVGQLSEPVIYVSRRLVHREMPEEVRLGFLGDPVFGSHRIHELARSVDEGDCVRDATAPGVVIPPHAARRPKTRRRPQLGVPAPARP